MDIPVFRMLKNVNSDDLNLLKISTFQFYLKDENGDFTFYNAAEMMDYMTDLDRGVDNKGIDFVNLTDSLECVYLPRYQVEESVANGDDIKILLKSDGGDAMSDDEVVTGEYSVTIPVENGSELDFSNTVQLNLCKETMVGFSSDSESEDGAAPTAMEDEIEDGTSDLVDEKEIIEIEDDTSDRVNEKEIIALIEDESNDDDIISLDEAKSRVTNLLKRVKEREFYNKKLRMEDDKITSESAKQLALFHHYKIAYGNAFENFQKLNDYAKKIYKKDRNNKPLKDKRNNKIVDKYVHESTDNYKKYGFRMLREEAMKVYDGYTMDILSKWIKIYEKQNPREEACRNEGKHLAVDLLGAALKGGYGANFSILDPPYTSRKVILPDISTTEISLDDEYLTSDSGQLFRFQNFEGFFIHVLSHPTMKGLFTFNQRNMFKKGKPYLVTVKETSTADSRYLKFEDEIKKGNVTYKLHGLVVRDESHYITYLRHGKMFLRYDDLVTSITTVKKVKGDIVCMIHVKDRRETQIPKSKIPIDNYEYTCWQTPVVVLLGSLRKAKQAINKKAREESASASVNFGFLGGFFESDEPDEIKFEIIAKDDKDKNDQRMQALINHYSDDANSGSEALQLILNTETNVAFSAFQTDETNEYEFLAVAAYTVHPIGRETDKKYMLLMHIDYSEEKGKVKELEYILKRLLNEDQDICMVLGEDSRLAELGFESQPGQNNMYYKQIR